MRKRSKAKQRRNAPVLDAVRGVEDFCDQLGIPRLSTNTPRESLPAWFRKWELAGRMGSVEKKLETKRRLFAKLSAAGMKGGAPKHAKNDGTSPRDVRVLPFGRRVDELHTAGKGQTITGAIDSAATEHGIGKTVRWDYWRDYKQRRA
jgi:hypothetical protein